MPAGAAQPLGIGGAGHDQVHSHAQGFQRLGATTARTSGSALGRARTAPQCWGSSPGPRSTSGSSLLGASQGISGGMKDGAVGGEEAAMAKSYRDAPSSFQGKPVLG